VSDKVASELCVVAVVVRVVIAVVIAVVAIVVAIFVAAAAAVAVGEGELHRLCVGVIRDVVRSRSRVRLLSGPTI
jgi:uncharacterized membrane protein